MLCEHGEDVKSSNELKKMSESIVEGGQIRGLKSLRAQISDKVWKPQVQS